MCLKTPSKDNCCKTNSWGDSNTKRVRFEPKPCNQGCCKNEPFYHPMPTYGRFIWTLLFVVASHWLDKS